MKKDIVSLIVPIYNVEKYLRECIESIINQTYNELEIILIDDGSPDSCGKICDEYALIDDRIKVIHKENGGLSDARNIGLENATGEYICFIDSDDFVSKYFVEKLYASIKNEKVLLSQCNFAIYHNNGSQEDKNHNVGKNKNSIDILFEQSKGIWFNTIVWNKMYHKSLLNNIRFPKGKINEDEFTTYKIFDSVEKVGIVEECLYYYRSNDESIMGKKFNLKRLDLLDALKERITFFENSNNELYNNTLLLYLNANKIIYYNVKSNNLDKHHSILRKLKAEFKVYYKLYWKNNKSVKKRINSMILRYIFPYRKYIFNSWDNAKKIKKEIRLFFEIINYKVKSISSKNKIFLLGIPVHGNLGDQALFYAENEFLKDYFKKFKTIKVESFFIKNNISKFEKIIKKDDVILIHAGGFLGTLWINEEEMFRTVLKHFKDNRIIVMPQSVYFEQDEDSKVQLEISKEIYNSHPKLTICCREKFSYEFVKNNFKCNVIMLPDMVMYINRMEDNKERKNVLFCIRNDKEKKNNDYSIIINSLKDYKIDYTDTVVKRSFDEKSGEIAVIEKIKEFSKYKLIITDRLHGFVFAYLAQTPCIVFENKSYKIKGVFEWIKDCNYIKMYNENTVKEDIIELLNMDTKIESGYSKDEYKKIVDLINDGKDKNE